MKKSIILIVMLSLIHAVSSARTEFNRESDSLKLQNDALKAQIVSLNRVIDSLTNMITQEDTGIYFQLIQPKYIILYWKDSCTASTVKSCPFNCKKTKCENKSFNIYIDSIKFVFQDDSLKNIRIYTATRVYKIDTPVSIRFSDECTALPGTEYAIKLHDILDIIEYSKISDTKRRYHILLTPEKNEKLIF